MKKINLNELVETYPISYEAIAAGMGKSRQWVHQLVVKKVIKRPELNRKHILHIQNYLQQAGREMIDLTANDISLSQFKKWPFSLSALSLYMKKPKFWLSDGLTNQNLSPDDIAGIALHINSIGSILHDVVLLDFIQHDDVSKYLTGRNSIFGIV